MPDAKRSAPGGTEGAESRWAAAAEGSLPVGADVHAEPRRDLLKLAARADADTLAGLVREDLAALAALDLADLDGTTLLRVLLWLDLARGDVARWRRTEAVLRAGGAS